MKPNTALLTDELYIDYETDLSFTGPVNWMYAPDYQGNDLPYALLFTQIRLGSASLPSLEKNTGMNLNMRTVSFQGSTSQAIVIYMPKNGCLRVLDPACGDQVTYNQLPKLLVDAIPLSDPSRIVVDSPEVPQLSLLKKPHTWCYYLDRAELARQKGDWESVIHLIDEATSLGYQPEDALEWLTYIEAQAMMRNIDIAQKVSMDALARDNEFCRGSRQLWKRIQADGRARGETNPRLSRCYPRSMRACEHASNILFQNLTR